MRFVNNRLPIRFKLTLLYTIILTLVVIVFSALLYSFQSQAMLNIMERRLTGEYRRINEQIVDAPDERRIAGLRDMQAKLAVSIVQIRDLDGDITQQSDRLGDAELPLNAAGYEAVTQGEVWLERVMLDGEWFLTRSQIGENADSEASIIQTAVLASDEIEYLNQLRTMLVIGDALVIVVAFGLGWVFARLALRPIHRITRTAQKVGAERDFSRRVDYAGPDDEIGQLSMTFNTMLAQLEDAYSQVERALQAQQQFVADASHELRTPLTTIRGNMELLQRQASLDVAERTDILTDAIDETDRLMRLVGELLTLARADAQQSLPMEPVRVQSLLDDVCRQARQLDAQHTVVLDGGAEETDLHINGNTDALTQILLILLDNAIKHTPPESTVTVSAGRAGDKVLIRVQDDGPGIDASTVPHAFERFYRGDTARTGPGAGLGLAIASELTAAQGGMISVESEAGRGCLFTLSFPVLLCGA